MAAAPSRDQIQLDEVLAALGHPVRLAIIRTLADNHEHRCGSVVVGVSKSTLTHHWKVLRDAGVIFQQPSGRENLLSLRRADLNARFPHLLRSVIVALDSDDATRTSTLEYAAAT